MLQKVSKSHEDKDYAWLNLPSIPGPWHIITDQKNAVKNTFFKKFVLRKKRSSAEFQQEVTQCSS
jgi:hypothetical protein